MINNPFYDQINMLNIVHLEEGSSVKNPWMKFPKLYLFLQAFQQHLFYYYKEMGVDVLMR
jgi:hypothetical protein